MRHDDDVEAMVEAWSHDRPDLDLGPLALTARVTRLARRFEQLQQARVANLGLKPGWLEVLSALKTAGPPHRLSPTELAASTLLTSGGMTSRLDRLEEAGLVRRKADPEDRRGTQVELTAEGRRVSDAAIDDQASLGEYLASPLGVGERRTLNDLVGKLLVAIERPDGTGRRRTEERAEAAAEEGLGASWIPRRGAGASPRGSALRGSRRPREERRGPNR